MGDNSYLTRPINFLIFNRKELPNNKKVDLIKKYKSLDNFDNERNFWNLMTPPIESDRGIISRKVPITPLVYKKDLNQDEEIALLGSLNKRHLDDIIEDVREKMDNVCVNNGFIDLRKIDWNNDFQQEEIEEINSIKSKQYKRIESKNDDGHNLTVKK